MLGFLERKSNEEAGSQPKRQESKNRKQKHLRYSFLDVQGLSLLRLVDFPYCVGNKF